MNIARLHRLAQGVSLKAITTVIDIVVGLAVSVLLNRIYGKEQYGQFVLVYAVASLTFAISDFGAKATLIRFIPLRLTEKHEADAAALYGTAFLVQLAGLTLIAGGLLLASRLIAEGIYHQPTLVPLIRVGIVYFAVFALFDFFVQTFQSLQDWRRESWLNIAFGVLRITSVIVVGFALHGTLADVLLGNAIAAAGAVALAVVWLPATMRRALARPGWRHMRGEIATIKGFGLPLCVLNLYQLVVTWSDKLLLGRFAAPADLAMYYIASLFINGLISLFKVLPIIFAPYVSEIAKADAIAVRQKFALIFRWFLQVVVITALVVFVAVEPIVTVVYGSSYLPVVPLARVLLIVFVLRACRDPFTLFQTNVFGRIGRAVSLAGVLALSTVLSTFALVPAFGVWGAVAAAIVSHVVTWVAFFWISPEFFPMLPMASMRAAGGALAVGVLGYLVLSAVSSHAIIAGAALVLLYLGGLVVFHEVSAQDVRIAGELFKANRNLFGVGQRAV